MVRRRLRALAGSVGPGTGSVVMATGIVSIALGVEGQTVISQTLLALAVVMWIGLVVVFCHRAAYDRARLRSEARTPAALSLVAATAVLGSRFLDLGWPGPGAAMLVLAGALWTVLIPIAVAALPRRVGGVAFLVTVASQSLAVLAAALAAYQYASLLDYVAVPLAGVGLILYPLVLSRFDLRGLWNGAGDQWICGGALAISALASGQITLTAARLRVLGGGGAVLQDLTLALWAAAVAWLPVLLAGELRRRRIRYDSLRWSTVFPLGMYAACSYAAGAATGTGALTDFARVWTWIALAGWTTTAFGLLRQTLAC